jgi:hypothetical protein
MTTKKFPEIPQHESIVLMCTANNKSEKSNETHDEFNTMSINSKLASRQRRVRSLIKPMPKAVRSVLQLRDFGHLIEDART